VSAKWCITVISLNQHNLWSWHQLGNESFYPSYVYILNCNLLVWWIIIYFRDLYEDLFSNYVSMFLLLEQTMPWKARILLQKKLKIRLKHDTSDLENMRLWSKIRLFVNRSVWTYDGILLVLTSISNSLV